MRLKYAGCIYVRSYMLSPTYGGRYTSDDTHKLLIVCLYTGQQQGPLSLGLPLCVYQNLTRKSLSKQYGYVHVRTMARPQIFLYYTPLVFHPKTLQMYMYTARRLKYIHVI